MRAIFSKVAAVSMIAGAGLVVSACGGTETTTTEVNNTTTEELAVENAMDTMTEMDAGNGMVMENTTTTTENTTVTTNTTM